MEAMCAAAGAATKPGARQMIGSITGTGTDSRPLKPTAPSAPPANPYVATAQAPNGAVRVARSAGSAVKEATTTAPLTAEQQRKVDALPANSHYSVSVDGQITVEVPNNKVMITDPHGFVIGEAAKDPDGSWRMYGPVSTRPQLDLASIWLLDDYVSKHAYDFDHMAPSAVYDGGRIVGQVRRGEPVEAAIQR